jgi:hypothetical protein
MTEADCTDLASGNTCRFACFVILLSSEVFSRVTLLTGNCFFLIISRSTACRLRKEAEGFKCYNRLCITKNRGERTLTPLAGNCQRHVRGLFLSVTNTSGAKVWCDVSTMNGELAPMVHVIVRAGWHQLGWSYPNRLGRSLVRLPRSPLIAELLFNC